MPNKWGDFLAGLSGAAGGFTQGLEQGRERKRTREQDEMQRQQFQAAMARATEELEQSKWQNAQDRELAARLRLPAGAVLGSDLQATPLDLLPYALNLSQETRLGAAAGREQGAYEQGQGQVPQSVSQELPWARDMTAGQFDRYASSMLQNQGLEQRAAAANQPAAPAMPEQWTFENSLRLFQETAAIRGDLMREYVGMTVQSDPDLMARVREAELANMGTPLTQDQIYRMMSPEQQEAIANQADTAAQYYWQQAQQPFGSYDQGAAGPQGQAAPGPQSMQPQGFVTPDQAQANLISTGQSQMTPSMWAALPRTALGQEQFPAPAGGTFSGAEDFASRYRSGMKPEDVIKSMLLQSGQLYSGSPPLPMAAALRGQGPIAQGVKKVFKKKPKKPEKK